MTKIQTIKKGESLDFEFDRDGDTVSGWTCTIYVRKLPGGSDLITPRVVVIDANSKWSGFLTQAETAALTASGESPHYLIAKLANTTTDEEEQKTKRFHVGTEWV